MTKKYRSVRVPAEAYDNFLNKKIKMEETIQNLTKRKNINIPLTNVLIEASKNPLILPDDYLFKLGKKRRKI